MEILEWAVLIMYIITDIVFGFLFLVVLEKWSSIWRKKTKFETFALIGTGWMFSLYLVNIILMVCAKM